MGTVIVSAVVPRGELERRRGDGGVVRAGAGTDRGAVGRGVVHGERHRRGRRQADGKGRVDRAWWDWRGWLSWRSRRWARIGVGDRDRGLGDGGIGSCRRRVAQVNVELFGSTPCIFGLGVDRDLDVLGRGSCPAGNISVPEVAT